MAKIVPLFSGSQGNSYYIGASGHGVLIDAGRSCKQITEALRANDIDINSIEALLITHEHSDHCSGVRVFAGKYNVPVYSSKGTANALIKDGKVDGKVNLNVIEDTLELADVFVERINTSHDAAESCCYRVITGDGKSAVVATDLGFISDDIRSAVIKSDAAVIESNHDVNMLKNGFYPYVLKRRILSDIGHLSNEACSDELSNFVRNNTYRFMLGHLSRENNTPELAYSSAVCALKLEKMSENTDYTLCVAPVVTDGTSVIY